MNLSRRRFMLGTAAAAVSASLPLPAYVFPSYSSISMRTLTEYVPDTAHQLDILFGQLRIRPEWTLSAPAEPAPGNGHHMETLR